jgi:hypothetical protein
MRYSPWAESRRVKILRLWEALALESLDSGNDQMPFMKAKEIARHVLEHPSTSTMYDYFADMTDSRWIDHDSITLRLLKIPTPLSERFAKQKQRVEMIVGK